MSKVIMQVKNITKKFSANNRFLTAWIISISILMLEKQWASLVNLVVVNRL